jgi:hypothetical protein
MSIKPSGGGALRAHLSNCMIGFVPNGESEWRVMKDRQSLSWIPINAEFSSKGESGYDAGKKVTGRKPKSCC